MDEIKIKRLSLKLFKAKIELEKFAEQNSMQENKGLLKIVNEISKIDKELLKESGIKFSNSTKEEILKFG